MVEEIWSKKIKKTNVLTLLAIATASQVANTAANTAETPVRPWKFLATAGTLVVR